MIKKFLANEDGATAIEYALITALIALGLITVLYSVRLSLNDLFNFLAAAFHS